MFDFQRLCSQLRIALSAPPVSLNLLIMKQIFCEHPVIIRNPQLKELLITHRCYTTLTGDHYISFAQANYFNFPLRSRLSEGEQRCSIPQAIVSLTTEE
jgi:hypothetical protein